MYKLFIALRYLRANKVIYFSIAGVAVGIMVMILVTSVMGGFSRDIQARIRGMQAHLVVKARFEDMLLGDYEGLIREIEAASDRVRGAVPRVEYGAWYNFRSYTRTVMLIGIDPEKETKAGELPQFFRRGGKTRFDFRHEDGRDPEHPGLVVGSELLPFEGAEVHLQSLRKADTPVFPQGEFTVVGAFKSGMAEYDSEYVFMHLAEMQRFMKLSGVVNSVAISVGDYDRDAEPVRATVLEVLHKRRPCRQPSLHEAGQCGSYRVQTWKEARSILLQAVAVERGIQIIILFCIILVAGFNIVAIYTMMVRAKTRDVGILRSLGATRGGIVMVFLLSGGLCGLIGSALGTLAGSALASNLNEVVGFVRITSRELNRTAWVEGGYRPATIWLANLSYVGALLALIGSWFSLYRPITKAAWILAIPFLGFGSLIAGDEPQPVSRRAWLWATAAALLLVLASLLFYGWAPGYEAREDQDPRLSSGLHWIIGSISGGLLFGWLVLRKLTDEYRNTLWGGVVRFGGVVLYCALFVMTAGGLNVTFALLSARPGANFGGWDLFPRQVYYLDSVPVLIDPGTVIGIVMATLFVSIVFSIWPALRAATVDPIEAIRDE